MQTLVLVWIQFIHHFVDAYVSPEELKRYRVVTSIGDEEDNNSAIEDSMHGLIQSTYHVFLNAMLGGRGAGHCFVVCVIVKTEESSILRRAKCAVATPPPQSPSLKCHTFN